MKDMIWNVYRYDVNKKRIYRYNVFNHGGFKEAVERAYTENEENFEGFAEAVRRHLQYYFWSKAEHEVIISPWIGDEKAAIKVDIYDQIIQNWDKFILYIWMQVWNDK